MILNSFYIPLSWLLTGSSSGKQGKGPGQLAEEPHGRADNKRVEFTGKRVLRLTA